MNLIPRNTWMDFDQVFDNFFTPSRLLGDNEKSYFTPFVDIIEKDDHYEIRADLPGVKKEDLKVGIDNGLLTIEASQKEEKEEKEGRIIRKERRIGQFMRSFTLDNNVQDKDITANFNDGVLTINAPKMQKRELPKPRQISIR